jgi:ribosomal protein S27E
MNRKQQFISTTKDSMCPKCKNTKMWLSRGQVNPQYKLKCTKCGHEVR